VQSNRVIARPIGCAAVIKAASSAALAVFASVFFPASVLVSTADMTMLAVAVVAAVDTAKKWHKGTVTSTTANRSNVRGCGLLSLVAFVQ